MNRFARELLQETTARCLPIASGALRLCAPRQMLLGASADMLGQPPDDSQANEQAEATLSELANVLLDVLLARAFGARDCPNIGLSHSSSIASVEGAEGATCSAVLVDMEGQPVVVSILAGVEVAA